MAETIVEESPDQRYQRFNKLLGKGAYKEVYAAYDVQEGIDVAWNQIDLTIIPTSEEKQKIFNECEMLKKLNHPNVLKIRHQWHSPECGKLVFITDKLQNGSLRKFFRLRKVNLSVVKEIAFQILSALQYLHNEQVIHRDLKCDNVFIDGVSKKIVIGDLGLSVEFNSKAYNDAQMSIVGM